MKHWAFDLIGRSWAPTPDLNCWGLVREVFRTRHGVDMPVVDVAGGADDDNVRAIKAASTASGWRLAEAPGRADDIVLMQGPTGRHVGVLIDAQGKLLLLHCAGHMTDHGPVGSVVAQPLADATRDGYHRYEFWRRA